MQRLVRWPADAANRWVYDVVQVPGMEGHPKDNLAVTSGKA